MRNRIQRRAARTVLDPQDKVNADLLAFFKAWKSGLN
jgi:hypothetical protein